MIDLRKVESYVINLATDTKRYNNVVPRFVQMGIHPQRFDAVFAKSLSKEYIDSVIHPYVQYTIRNNQKVDPDISTLGAVGCALSHIELWKKLVDSDQEMFLILEDDALPKVGLKELNSFVNSVNKVDSNWDVIYLGFCKPIPSFENKDIVVNDSVFKIDSLTLSTHSYLVNKKGAKKLLTKAIPIVHHIDNYMSFMAMHGLNSYRPKKSLVVPDNLGGPLFSSINTRFTVRPLLSRIPGSALSLIILTSIFILIYVIADKCGKCGNKK